MPAEKSRQRVVILGAAGRDFHNFNQVYRRNPDAEVIAFTATQISGISGRRYPPSLSGPLFPEGVPIFPQSELSALCREQGVEQVVLAYSDISHLEVMGLASQVLALGADFVLLGPEKTYLKSPIPVIAVSAVRTGCGKSQTSRWLSQFFRRRGLKVGALRHPMPYGDLERQAVQCFASLEDLAAADCTVEEREEYEPYLAAGHRVYAGVDYEAILARAARENDLILWDGGNNDFPFIRPDLHLVLVDPLRPGDESRYHPGETVLRMADIVIIPKVDSADPEAVATVTKNIAALNPTAAIIHGLSPIQLERAESVRGQKVLVIEDGPTTTHGGMGYGAGYVAALRAGAGEIVDPLPWAAPAIAQVYQAYPHLKTVLPALGYSPEQLAALAETINRVEADLVVSGTPSDLGALIQVNKPILRARYEFAEAHPPALADAIEAVLHRVNLLKNP